MGSDNCFVRGGPELAPKPVFAGDGFWVWHFLLDESPMSPGSGSEPGIDYNTLSADEWLRADRFRRLIDRRRFVQARTALRHLLGVLIGIAPGAIEFTAGPHGKLSVSKPDVDLAFNISHAENDLLIAVSSGFPVGVDIEYPQARAAYQPVAETFFTPGERRVLKAAHPPAQPWWFQAIWTAKEAYGKGLGLGLSLDPTSFDLLPAMGGFWVFDPARPAPRWWVHTLRLGQGRFGHELIGALAHPSADGAFGLQVGL